MPGRRSICVAVLVTLLIAPASRAEDTNWWGRKLPDIPTNFIFGYGSLINTASRNSTAGASVPAIPVRVSANFGYIRGWNDHSPSGFTALGLRKPRPGETTRTINGVVYPIAGDDMAKFDAREAGYVRVEVPHEDIEAVSWQAIPANGHIWTYVPFHSGSRPGEGLPQPDAGFPLLESYIDIVVEGSLEYGTDFARELIETTADWSEFWLNDRELARRPWVHDNKYAAVDRLLKSVTPSASQFPNRLFAEQYAVRWSGKLQ